MRAAKLELQLRPGSAEESVEAAQRAELSCGEEAWVRESLTHEWETLGSRGHRWVSLPDPAHGLLGGLHGPPTPRSAQ